MTGLEVVPAVQKGIVTGFFSAVTGKVTTALLSKRALAKWKALFLRKRFVVLGEARSGKTSLILFLTTGKPFRIDDDGIPLEPDRTQGKLDAKATVKWSVKMQIDADVGGDPAWYPHWLQLLATRPHGIIYMIDGRRKDIDSAVESLFTRVLDAAYKDDAQNLDVVHVFVNFKDKWNRSDTAARKKLDAIRSAISAALDARPHLDRLAFEVSPTHLAQKGPWPEVNRAMKRFGEALKGD